MFLRSISLHSKDQAGATIVEFAFAIIGIVGVISVVVDFGFAFWRHSLMTDTSMAQVREIAADLASKYNGNPQHCSLLAEEAKISAQSYSEKQIGVPKETQMKASILPPSQGDRFYHLKVSAQTPFQCLLCILFPGRINLWHESEAPIGNSLFECR